MIRTILFIAILLSLIWLTACSRKEYSAEMYEEGRVVESRLIPAHTDVDIGIDVDGNPTVDFVRIPDEYIMRFSCEHGEFRVSNTNASLLYDILRRGDRVIITYRRIDMVKEKDGVEVSRHFGGWDFVTAKPFDPEGPTEH